MASPFSIFRKRRGLMLAILAILSMFAFVIIDPLMQWMSTTSRSGENPVVVTTRNASLREFDLVRMQNAHTQVLTFLEILLQESELTRFAHSNSIQVLRQIGPATERQVVFNMLLVEMADDMGMVVTDDAVNRFLRELTGGSVNDMQIRKAISRVGSSPRAMYSALREKLKAMQMRELLEGGISRGVMEGPLQFIMPEFAPLSLRAMTPAQRWDYFQRMRTSAQIQLVELPIDEFKHLAGKPSEKELRDLYAKYKYDLPLPRSPKPGFKIPARSSFDYLVAYYDRFEEEIEISEEEVKQYYEENKDHLYKNRFPEEEMDESDGGPKSGEVDKKTEPGKEPAGKDGSGDQQPPKPSKEATPGKKESNKQSEQPKSDKQGATATSPADDNLLALAFADDADQAKSADKPDKADVEKGDQNAESDKQAGESEETAGEEKPAMPVEEIKTNLSLPGEASLVPKYRPLNDQLKKRIRSQLKASRTPEAIERRLSEIKAKLETFVIQRDFEQEADRKAAEEYMKSFAKKDKRLAFRSTRLLSRFEINESDELIGESYFPDPTGQSQRRQPFVAVAYDENMGTFIPHNEFSQNFAGDRFLFWKAYQTKEKVPSFKEARVEVARAWEEIQGRKEALKLATSFVEAARRNEDKDLKQAWEARGKEIKSDIQNAPEEVQEAGPFSWMSGGRLQQARIGFVPGVDNPGNEFMRAVFALDQGEFGTAFNQAHSKLYLVYVREFQRPQFEDFIAEPPQTYANPVRIDSFEKESKLIEHLEEQAKVTWNREPDTRR